MWRKSLLTVVGKTCIRFTADLMRGLMRDYPSIRSKSNRVWSSRVQVALPEKRAEATEFFALEEQNVL